MAVKDAVADLANETNPLPPKAHVRDAKDAAGDMVETVKSTASDYNDTFVGLIRKNPYKSLAIAAGVGFVAGMMLRRR